MGTFRMPTVSYTYKGNLKSTRNFLKNIKQSSFLKHLDKYGEMGVQALSNATPKDTGKTADSWGYVIESDKESVTITWTNSNESEHVPVALLIQYGHATKNGGWVTGIDYINPALKPIFEKLAKSAWEEVTKS